MILIHNDFEEKSRELINEYGDEYEVLEYPSCVEDFPAISAFPSVAIEVPSYHYSGTDVSGNVPGHFQMARDPDLGAIPELADYQQQVRDRAANNPPKDGAEEIEPVDKRFTLVPSNRKPK